jgi:hypothetical protein
MAPVAAAGIATGPFAPITAAAAINLQSTGDRITNQYQAMVDAGMDPGQAAQKTFAQAEAGGAAESLVWAALPGPLRNAADKYLIDKIGAKGVSRLLLNRAAQFGEGATLGTANRIASNTATGEPLAQGVGGSALGLGLLQAAIMPRGRSAFEHEAYAEPYRKVAEFWQDLDKRANEAQQLRGATADQAELIRRGYTEPAVMKLSPADAKAQLRAERTAEIESMKQKLPTAAQTLRMLAGGEPGRAGVSGAIGETGAPRRAPTAKEQKARMEAAKARAKETAARAGHDIAKSNYQRVLDHHRSRPVNADRFRTNAPKPYRSTNDVKQIKNGIAFLKKNLVKTARLALKEPWARRYAAKQYEGYNIQAHEIADEFQKKPETVMLIESAESPNTSPDNSFEATRRILKILRDNTGDRFDERMADWARNKMGKNSAGELVHLYDPADVDALMGKKFSELPAKGEMQAKWLRAFDEVYHPDRMLRVVRPDGTLGDTVKTSTGADMPFAWTTFKPIQSGIDAALEQRTPEEILSTPKVANYYMSKLLAFHPSDHVVVDTHHTSAAWGNSLPSSNPLVKDVFAASRAGPDDEFAGYYSIVHEATLQAAKEVGMEPKEFQALVWAYQRGLKSPDVLGPVLSEVIQGLWTDAARGKITEEQAYDGTEHIARDFHGGKVPAPDYYAGGRFGSAGAPPEGTSGKPAELPQGGGIPEPALRGGRVPGAAGAAVEPGSAPGGLKLRETRDVGGGIGETGGPRGSRDEEIKTEAAGQAFGKLRETRDIGGGVGAVGGPREAAEAPPERRIIIQRGAHDPVTVIFQDRADKDAFVRASQFRAATQGRREYPGDLPQAGDRDFYDKVRALARAQDKRDPQDLFVDRSGNRIERAAAPEPAQAPEPTPPAEALTAPAEAPAVPGAAPIVASAGPPAPAAGPKLPTQDELEADANDPQKMRGHIATVKRMTEVSPPVKFFVESYYTPTTLKAVTDNANGKIDAMGLDKAKDVFTASRKTDADTMAFGQELALRLDKFGRYDEAAEVRDAMAAKLTGPAQAMWFISTISKTSPQGLINTAQKLVAGVLQKNPRMGERLAEFDQMRAKLGAMRPGPLRDAEMHLMINRLARVGVGGERLGALDLANLLKKQQAGVLTPDELRTALIKAFGIPQLTRENVRAIQAAQKVWEAVPADNPLLKLKRGAEMMDTVYGLVPHDLWDKVRATAVISMILHGRLPLRIGISNALRMFGQMTADAVLNVPRDVGNVFMGRKTITAAQLDGIASGLLAPGRAFAAGYSDARLRGLTAVPSFKEGMETLIDLSSLTTRGMFEASDITRSTHTFSSRFGRLFEDAVTLLHNTVPYGFWSAGFHSSLARQMTEARVATPTAEMISNAHLDANKAIFYNDTALYKALLAVRNGLNLVTGSTAITKGKYGVGTALIPFAKVPAAILSEGATWTPFGLGKAGIEILRPFVTGESFDGRAAGEAVVKAALGTGSLALAGYQLAKIGVLTGAPDENRDIEAMRKASGWGAYRINMSELRRRAMSGNWWQKSTGPADGDMIINYNWLEPVAFPIAMGADLAHSELKQEIDLKRGKITSNAALRALGAGVGSMADSPMLQNLQQALQTAVEQPWKIPVELAANVPGNFIPSLVRQTGQYMDNQVRETRGGTFVEQEANRLLSQLPGLSQKYPPKYDVFGDAVQRYNYGNNSLINIFFNPAMVSKFKTEPGLKEMTRMYEATGSSEQLARAVPATLMINGKQVQLTNEQLSAYQRYVGQVAPPMIARLLAAPAFAAEPLTVKQNMMGQILNATNNAAKVDLFGQSPVSVGLSLKGPKLVGKPDLFELAAIQNARRLGLNQPVSGPLARPAGTPVWPPPQTMKLPSLAP